MEACRAFHKQFPQLEYLGIDFVVTSNDKVKILEINSLTSIGCDSAGWFYSGKRGRRIFQRAYAGIIVEKGVLIR